jgi:quercetin dioxygenase-like cupin family protein
LCHVAVARGAEGHGRAERGGYDGCRPRGGALTGLNIPDGFSADTCANAHPKELNMGTSRIQVVSFVSLCALTAASALAQQASAPALPAVVSKPLIASPLTGDDKKEIVLMSVAIQPAGAVPLHTHPGDCVGSVLEGTVELLVDGQPPRRVAAGDTYANPRGTPHGFRNVGETPARLLNSLVLDKGAPRVQPVVPPSRP